MKKIDLSKRQRSVVRDLAAIAYEREMRNLLTGLADAFEQWRGRKLGTWDFLHALDQFAVPRRRLKERYEASTIAPMMVAYAFASGLLSNDEVPTEILQALAKPIAFYRDGLADGSISMEEED